MFLNVSIKSFAEYFVLLIAIPRVWLNLELSSINDVIVFLWDFAAYDDEHDDAGLDLSGSHCAI